MQKQLNLFYKLPEKPHLVVSYGMGVDSTAMLIEMEKRNIRPDDILFADVGSEKPETYQYRQVIEPWLESVGFPPLTEVKYVPKKFKNSPYTTLEGNCLSNATLPSLAFGFKSCSLKWKGAPMDSWVKKKYKQEIDAGMRITRAIGYDAGLKDRKRCGGASENLNDPAFKFIYPLVEWGVDRKRCVEIIKEAGLPVPVKSACFFCPATQKDELLEMADRHPDLIVRAVAIEDTARPNLKKIKGLWGTGIKGVRKPASARPGSWRVFLQENGYLQ